MLSLHFAPSLDLLVPRLLAEVRLVWTDPFVPPAVIVPSPALGKWLRMRLADGSPGDDAGNRPLPLGCVANLELPTLERYLWRSLSPSPGMEMLDVEHLRQVVCALLDKDLLGRDIYRPLREYLTVAATGETDPLKRVQLSARIAHQFLEYEYNRPSVWDPARRQWRSRGIDACWIAGSPYPGMSDDDRWQMDLYRTARERASKSPHAGSPRQYVTLPHLHRMRRERGVDGGGPWTVAPGRVFLFGVTKVSHFHRNALVEISQMPGVDMDVFLTNPCAEFWEDIDTRRSRTVRRAWKHDSATAGIGPRAPEDYQKEKLVEGADFPRDHELLALWGAAGKENIFLWCPQAQWNFEYHSPAWAESDLAPATLLKAVQRSLLRGQNELPARAGGWRDDGTLRVLACPDRRREIEEVREEILDLVKSGAIDKLTDVAVYLPDPGAYVPHIHRVFGAFRPQEPGHIPFTILGAPGSDSVLAQGVRVLLDLAEGNFDRSRVFALLRNPIVQSSRGFTAGQVAVWESWAEELGIYRGFNEEHRREMGDTGPVATDAHTFEQGMARALIGNLAFGPVAMDFRLVDGAAGAALPPFRDFDTGDRGLLETFCAIIEGLYHDTRGLRAAVDAGIADAVDRLDSLVRTWFGDIPAEGGLNSAGELRVRGDLLSALSSILLQAELAGRGHMPLREFLALAGGCLPGELATGSSAWTGGVTFAPLRPAMVVPHRVVFVVGLDATAFPGTAEKPGWDLLSRKRIVGDSDPVRDNRFAFLELLHAAGERLVLSFRARDMQKEVDLQPSSVVLELEGYLRNQGLVAGAEGERCAVRTDVPWIVHESLEAIRAGGRAHGSWDPVEIDLARIAAGPDRADHRHDLPRGDTASPRPAAALHTTIHHLRKFFANPLEYHLSKTLGIELDEEPATEGASDEPLASGNLVESNLHKEIWKRLLAGVFPERGSEAVTDPATLAGLAESVARRVYGAHIASGRSPEAQFCLMEERRIVDWARQSAEVTLRMLPDFPDHRLLDNTDLSLGREGVAGELTVELPENGSCTVECRHGLVLVPRRSPGAGDAVGIIAVKTRGTAKEDPDLWMAGVVQWLAEQCAGERALRAIRLVLLTRAKPDVDCARISEAREGARRIPQWFGALLREMVVDRCSDHLPFAVVRKLHESGWESVTGERAVEELGNYRCFLESFALADARIPKIDDAQLRERARRRFAPLLEGWLHE